MFRISTAGIRCSCQVLFRLHPTQSHGTLIQICYSHLSGQADFAKILLSHQNTCKPNCDVHVLRLVSNARLASAMYAMFAMHTGCMHSWDNHLTCDLQVAGSLHVLLKCKIYVHAFTNASKIRQLQTPQLLSQWCACNSNNAYCLIC